MTVERDGRIERRRLHADGSPDVPEPAPLEPAAAAAAGEVLAELRGVTKAYNGHAVLSELDLSVRRGRLTAVVGRSGSGKTTLLHLFAGLVRPSAGDVLVSGMAFDERSRSALADLRRQTIAVVTQEPGLVPHLSARENVLLGLSLRRNGAHLDGADDALDMVGLAELRGRRAATLSAGERQRVAIARALAAKTPLLLADEPTARLDEENARIVGELLARATREREIAVVCATHDQALIELADDVVRLEPAE